MLHWQHRWGKHIRTWELLIERGREPPAAYYDRPEVLPCHEFYWVAFCDLVTERSIGMGVGPIPRSKVIAYAERADLGGEDAVEFFWAVIHALDGADIAGINKTQKPPEKDEPSFSVAVNDNAGLRDFFAQFGARQKAKAKSQQQ